ncbi:unnamed protein product [Phaedon cochleariae]|uniref:lysozyme n=1 Tax=Phaedon cochleariae TaxID=80249 RepID=A0A9P0GIX6_PHACE|nr:unnamed protein product [Phaedon cochleariae]
MTKVTHYLLQSMLLKVEETQAGALPLVEEVLPDIFGKNDGLFIRVKVKDYLFDGLKMCENGGKGGDFTAGLVCKQVMAQVDNAKNMRVENNSVLFANLHYKNNTHLGRFTIKAGIKNREQTAHLVSYNNQSYLSVWQGEKSICNKIEGLMTTVFPVNIEKDMVFESFAEDICRRMSLTYQMDETVKGLVGYKFTAKNDSFSSKNKNNSCYCTNKSKLLHDEMGCVKDGITDLSTCTAKQSSQDRYTSDHFTHDTMLLALFILDLVLILTVNAKVYDRCELAKELRQVHGFPENQISTWVCIAQHESLFNTSATNHGSGDHGLFQISQIYWCSPPGYGCNAPCSSFRDDDITDDVNCVKKIFREHTRISGDGFTAWTVYQLYCKGDTTKYIGGCYDSYIDNSINNVIDTDVDTRPIEEDDDGYEFPALPSKPKVYDRCELARELRNIHRFSSEQVSKWVCIAAHESSYNTSALGRGDHGIFQISELFWCSPFGRGNGCNADCASFRDHNLADDITCAKAIYDEHTGISGDGFNAWAVYPLFCKGDTSRYVDDCFETKENHYPTTGNTNGYVFPQTLSKPRVYSRCELAMELQNVYKFPKEQISKWVCIAEHESSYNTSALGRGDHGLFQISEQYWCSPIRRGLACNANCASFRDNNIADDIKCIKMIYEEHTAISGDGFDAWAVYPLYCKGDTSRYVSGCFEDDEHDDGYQFPPLPSTPSKVLENLIDSDEDDTYEFPPLPSFAKMNRGEYNRRDYDTISLSVPSPIRTRIYSTEPTIGTYSSIRSPFLNERTTEVQFHIFPTSPSPRARHLTFRPFPTRASTTLRPRGSRPRPPVPGGNLGRPPKPPGGIARPLRPSSNTTRPSRPTPRPPPPPPAGPIFTLWPTSTTSPVATSVYGIRPKPPSEPETQEKFGGALRTTTSRISVQRSRAAKKVLDHFPGGPVMVSFPHLLYADKEYLGSVDGLHPDRLKHESFVILEPLSGFPLSLAQRVQFNIFLRPIESLVIMENVSRALFPLIWIEETLLLDDKFTDMLKNNLHKTLKILNIITWVVITSGAACILFTISFVLYKNVS